MHGLCHSFIDEVDDDIDAGRRRKNLIHLAGFSQFIICYIYFYSLIIDTLVVESMALDLTLAQACTRA